LNMQIRRIAAHSFKNSQMLPFDPAEFSRFKYGSARYARVFGRVLSQSFLASPYFQPLVEALQNGRKAIVYPPPYINLPTAAYYLATEFVNLLNEQLHNMKLPAVYLGKIYRRKSYCSDYGSMSEAERNAIFEDEVFYADEHLLQTAFSLFLDDIWITGAHERRILKMLEASGVDYGSDCLFLYFAKLENPVCDPSIESYLNLHAIHDFQSVLDLMEHDGFCWNTRVVKYLLLLPAVQFDLLIENLGLENRRQLYHWAINNGYCQLKNLEPNFHRLKSTLYETASHLLPH
jgi:PRTase ComF-like